MAASHLFSNKKNSKGYQHINFGKHTGAGLWWALPWAHPWALGLLLGPPLGLGGALDLPGALRGSGPAEALGPSGALPWALPWAYGGPAGIGPCRGPNKYIKRIIFNV